MIHDQSPQKYGMGSVSKSGPLDQLSILLPIALCKIAILPGNTVNDLYIFNINFCLYQKGQVSILSSFY